MNIINLTFYAMMEKFYFVSSFIGFLIEIEMTNWLMRDKIEGTLLHWLWILNYSVIKFEYLSSLILIFPKLYLKIENFVHIVRQFQIKF